MKSHILSPRIRALAVALTVTVLALTLTSPGHSFVLLNVDWAGSSANYRVNDNFPADPGGTSSEQITAIRNGADAWRNQAGADFDFNYLGTTSETSVDTGDGTNAVFYTATSGGGGTLAVCWYSFNFADNFTGFDIVFHGENGFGDLTWNGVGDSSSIDDELDIIGVAVHEFGHALGLDHTTAAGATMRASISGTGLGARTLAQDDIDGVIDIYGEDLDIDTGPQINDVDPPSGSVDGGEEVVITGVNFTWDSDTDIDINGVAVPGGDWELPNSSTLIITSMPEGDAGFASITISNALGDVTLDEAYEYISPDAPPVVTACVPTVGSIVGGETVTIIGEEFTSGSTVTFGANDATTVTFISPTELEVVTPASTLAGIVDVTVTQAGGTDTLVDGFEFHDDFMQVTHVTGFVGSTTEVEVLGTFGADINGYSFGVDHDATVLEVLSITTDDTDADGAEFVGPLLDNGTGIGEGYVTLGVLFGVSNPDLVIPAGIGKSIARITYAVSDDATDGDTTDLEMRDDLGIEAVALSFIADGEVRTPATANGSVEFVEGSTFLRGDADSNGTVFALVDGLFILAWAFNGGPAPTCEDSVDIDDNGTIFALVDVLYLLEWSFSGGPVPPSPGVSTCGTDPTDDTLNCDNSGCP